MAVKEQKRTRGRANKVVTKDALELAMPSNDDLRHFCGEIPNTDKQKRLCIEYIRDRNSKAAALRAGWSETAAAAEAYRIVGRYDAYIRYLEACQAKANAKQIAIELEPALQEIAKIAFVNEYDYLVVDPPTKDNEPPVVRRKRLDELSREQMIPLIVFRRSDGSLDYKLRDKEARLVELIKHLGGFNETIILEHRHRHLHAHIDLTNVPQDQLDDMERQMEALIGGKTKGTALKVN